MGDDFILTENFPQNLPVQNWVCMKNSRKSINGARKRINGAQKKFINFLMKSTRKFFLVEGGGPFRPKQDKE